MNLISIINKNLKNVPKDVEIFDGKEVYYKKSINPLWASFFTLSYTALTIFGTSYLLGSQAKEDNSEQKLSEMRSELLLEIRKTKAPIIVSSNDSRNQIEKLRAEIIDEVNRMNIKYLDIIEQNKHKYTAVIKAVSERKPASISEGKKVLPFNSVNEEVLVFKHQKLYNREKEKLKEKETLEISNLDLTNSNGIDKMKKIQDETEVALFELKQKLYYKRVGFRKDKYIVMND